MGKPRRGNRNVLLRHRKLMGKKGKKKGDANSQQAEPAPKPKLPEPSDIAQIDPVASQQVKRSHQRWFHYFFLNEFITFLVVLWLCTCQYSLELSPIYRVGFVILGAFSFINVMFGLVVCLSFVKRYFRPSYKLLSSEPCFDLGQCPSLPKAPEFKSKDIRARDGVKLRVHIATGKPQQGSKTCPVMLLPAPLGQCGPGIYDPIRARFGDRFTYVSWDYRGLFESEVPRHTSDTPRHTSRTQWRRIAIPEHAEDAVEVLTSCGFDKCQVMLGHSMGTAVALVTCLLFPDKVESLVMLNGFHGHVYQTAFQPVCRFPFIADLNAKLVSSLIDHPRLLSKAFKMLPKMLKYVLPMYAKLFGSKLMCKVSGDAYFLSFMKQYTKGLWKSESSMQTFLHLCQELNSHSVFHLLDTIQQPTLCISGLLDVLIPAQQSVELSRRIPNCDHYSDPFSSHASLMESPEWCVAEIEHFFLTRARIFQPLAKATKVE